MEEGAMGEGEQAVRVALGEMTPAPSTGSGQASTGSGSTAQFEVLAMQPGVANGITFPAEALAASAAGGLWEGATVFVDHDGSAPTRSVQDVAGVVTGTRYADGVRGVLRCAGPKAGLVAALGRELLADLAAGRPAPAVPPPATITS
jgi:hypothetical protein